jgi:glycosyltransferase involved in cell wall biosynthesis
MKLSFVIPAYNEEKYIGKCLESILKNAEKYLSDIEIIVVNNASTDKTKKTALSYPHVQVVDEPRKGIAFARNAGYLKAKGELIANIDADCILPPGWIERAFEVFKKKEILALSGPVTYYDLSSNTALLVKLYYYFVLLIHIIKHRLLKIGAIAQGANFIIRKSVLDEIGGYNTDFTFYGEEIDTVMRVQKLGRVYYDFNFKMLTSGRRLAKEGVVNTGAKYAANYFSTVLTKKPLHKKHQDIRP